jgi:hypothetical protein
MLEDVKKEKAVREGRYKKGEGRIRDDDQSLIGGGESGKEGNDGIDWGERIAEGGESG